MRSFLFSLAMLLAVVGLASPALATDPAHPREAEAVRAATNWLDLVEEGKLSESLAQLTETFRANLTEEAWRESNETSARKWGPLKERKLRRVVVYQDPAEAPLPGTYVAVEYDSVYANTSNHFQYVILHSLSGEPFKVMRREVVVAFDHLPGGEGAR